MKATIILTIVLVFVLFINIFLLATGVILVWKGQNPTYLSCMPKALIEIRRGLTNLPCLRWHKKIENEMSSLYFSFCTEDEDCVWYPSCEFGCYRAINPKNKNQLKEKILRWKKFCWQNDSCVGKDYTCLPIEVKCIKNHCRPVLEE